MNLKLVHIGLGPALIQYTVVSSLSPDIKVVVVPAGSNFLFGDSILGGK